MRILTWNVNGIRNPFSYHPWRENRSYVSLLESLGADIVCFQELKIQKKDLSDDMVAIPGWNVFLTLPVGKKGYSGVAVYCKQSTCTPIKAEEGITGWLTNPAARKPFRQLPSCVAIGGYPDLEKAAGLSLDSEGRAIVLDFGLFVFVGTYCPAVTEPSRDAYRMQFLETLGDRLRRISEDGRQVILAGDINICRDLIDTADPKRVLRNLSGKDFKDTPARTWLDTMLLPREGGLLIDTCRHFHPERQGMFTCWETRINARAGNYGSRIDYVFCTPGLMPWIEGADIQPQVTGSDHCPVYADLRQVLNTSSPESYLLDSVNPPASFECNRLIVPFYPQPPKLCARNYAEFSSRQSVLTMLGPSKRATDEKSHVISPKRPCSQSPVKRLRADAPSPPPQQRRVIDYWCSKAPIVQANIEKDKEEVGEIAQDIEWAIEKLNHKTEDQAKTWSKFFERRSPPKCTVHQEECIELTAKKPGQNMGRRFWICSRPVGPGYDDWSRPKHEIDDQFRCGYFKWSSELRRERSGSGLKNEWSNAPDGQHAADARPSY